MQKTQVIIKRNIAQNCTTKLMCKHKWYTFVHIPNVCKSSSCFVNTGETERQRQWTDRQKTNTRQSETADSRRNLRKRREEVHSRSRTFKYSYYCNHKSNCQFFNSIIRKCVGLVNLEGQIENRLVIKVVKLACSDII